jgi:hypothetical protein
VVESYGSPGPVAGFEGKHVRIATYSIALRIGVSDLGLQGKIGAALGGASGIRIGWKVY